MGVPPITSHGSEWPVSPCRPIAWHESQAETLPTKRARLFNVPSGRSWPRRNPPDVSDREGSQGPPRDHRERLYDGAGRGRDRGDRCRLQLRCRLLNLDYLATRPRRNSCTRPGRGARGAGWETLVRAIPATWAASATGPRWSNPGWSPILRPSVIDCRASRPGPRRRGRRLAPRLTPRLVVIRHHRTAGPWLSPLTLCSFGVVPPA